MADETLAVLKQLDAKLSVIVAIAVDQHLRETGRAQPRPPSIEQILVDAGLTGTEAGRLLG